MKSNLTLLIIAILIFNNISSQNVNLNIGPDAKVTLMNGVKVKVNGVVKIEASSLGFGSLVIDADPDTELDVSQNSEVEIYLTHDQWHIISPPISDAIINTFLNIYLREFDGTEDTAGGGIYYQNNWKYLSVPVTIPMNVMQGYSVWNQSASGKSIFTYPGTLNNGVLTNLSLTNSGPGTPEGWNLAGNPYPCSIDLDAPVGWSSSNIDAAIYYWDISQYKVYSAAGLGGIGSGTGSRYVPSNQGFFIKCNNPAGGSLCVNNNVRVHSDASFYKNSKSLNDFLRIKVEGNNDYDEIIVHFDTNATKGYDGKYDAFKLYGLLSAPQLYTLTPDADSIKLTINTINPDTTILNIPLCLEVGNTGNYVITASELASFKPGVKIYLEDLITSNITDLTQNPVYSFIADTSDVKLRFLLRFDLQTVSINKAEDEKPYFIYSSDKIIHVNMWDLNEKVKVRIYDLLGRELYNSNYINSDVVEIDLNGKPNSIYIVLLETDTRLFSEKVFLR